MKEKVVIFWFRRDLRLLDNAGLYHALRQSRAPVLPLFIFDTHILSDLPDEKDPRVHFIHQSLSDLKLSLEELGSSLLVRLGQPSEVWKKLLDEYEVISAFTNHDYEPYAKERDQSIGSILAKQKIEFHTFKDHVIFESAEVSKDDGSPYTVFTPYKRKWLEKLASRDKNGTSFYLSPYPCQKYAKNYFQCNPLQMPTLREIGFSPSEVSIPAKTVKQSVIKNYDRLRNFPAVNGTSRLGIHFRFGTISIREKALKAKALNETFLSELIWRDFYSQILDQFPHVVNGPFRQKYDRIPWRDDEGAFQAWCTGSTGYPLVDAGMRELNETGYMHNRVRMVVASFLTKHLLIDWRKGEAYFAQKLLDYDLASNNGGWQWAAGCGTDAAPYFRIFNPESQRKKFDGENKYVEKWIPGWNTSAYPPPIVDHSFARQRCLETFKAALQD